MQCELIRAAFVISALSMQALPAAAGGVFLDVPMTRVFACQGADAAVEIYVPQSVLQKRNVETMGLGRTVNGLSIVQSAGAQKQKVIEPVRLRSTRDNAITVERFLHKGMKPIAIPMAGGRLDFDQRAGSKVTCEPFRQS
jgi:hypothetical protein